MQTLKLQSELGGGFGVAIAIFIMVVQYQVLRTYFQVQAPEGAWVESPALYQRLQGISLPNWDSIFYKKSRFF